MLESKLQEAKLLIQNKQYDDARKLLESISHPTATKWLAKLDEIAPKMPLNKREKRTAGNFIVPSITGLIGLIVGLVIGATVFGTNNGTVSTTVPLNEATNQTANDQSQESNLVTVDDMRSRISDGLHTYCFVPIDLFQAFDTWHQRNDITVMFPSLLNADINQLCTIWTDEMVDTRYEAAEFCRQEADDEFRDATFFECLDDRNFHFGSILGEGWAITASDVLETEQLMRQSYGIGPGADMRTTTISG